MRFTRKRFLAIVIAGLLVPAVVWVALFAAGLAPAPGSPRFPPFNLSDRLSTLEVVGGRPGEPGEVRVVFPDAAGGARTLAADEFLEEVRRRQETNRGWSRLFGVLDITSWTSLFWVLFGLAGQALFTGRMLVQWLASEQARSSVVPPAFWWLSLGGSSMLIVYFIWRIEIVGIIGQATGWFIYVRNLWFIYGRRDAPKPARRV